MDSQTRQQVRWLRRNWTWGGLLIGIFIGNLITRLMAETGLAWAILAWTLVAPLCAGVGAVLTYWAHRKYYELTDKEPIAKGQLGR